MPFSPDPMPLYTSDDKDGVMDHIYWFKDGRRPMAIVSMPYGHVRRASAEEMAARYGLEVQEPPVAKSGWWVPGETHCFCFVRPGTTVRWLPEQVRAPWRRK